MEIDNSAIVPKIIIDARQQHNILILLEIKKKIISLKRGEIIQIDSDDSALQNDIESWCSNTENNYLGEKGYEIYTSYYISSK